MNDGYDRSDDGKVIAPMLYPSTSLELALKSGLEAEVAVIGEPSRGVMSLMTCYSPPWWYVICSNCSWLNYVGSPAENSSDPRLLEIATTHRCKKKEDSHGT